LRLPIPLPCLTLSGGDMKPYRSARDLRVRCDESHPNECVPVTFQLGAYSATTAFYAPQIFNKLRVFNAGVKSESLSLRHLKGVKSEQSKFIIRRVRSLQLTVAPEPPATCSFL